MSSVFTPHTLLACLNKVKKGFKPEDLTTSNKDQKEFIKTIMTEGFLDDLSFFSEEELKSISSSKCSEVNKWLSDNGFPDLQLDDFGAMRDLQLYIASILKVCMRWKDIGKTKTIRYNLKNYKAVKLDSPTVCAFTIPWWDDPIISIQGEREDEFSLITKCKDKNNLSKYRFNYGKKIDEKYSELKQLDCDYAIFPFVKFREKVDISFLEGLMIGGWEIFQAIQKTIFEMDEKGAKVESASAFGLKRSIATPKPYFIIDTPFIFEMYRKNMKNAYFCGYFTPEHWIEEK